VTEGDELVVALPLSLERQVADQVDHIMSEVETTGLTSEDVLKLLGSMQTAVEATTSSAAPLLTKYVNLAMHIYEYS
jgi:hypothetical protein